MKGRKNYKVRKFFHICHLYPRFCNFIWLIYRSPLSYVRSIFWTLARVYIVGKSGNLNNWHMTILWLVTILWCKATRMAICDKARKYYFLGGGKAQNVLIKREVLAGRVLVAVPLIYPKWWSWTYTIVLRRFCSYGDLCILGHSC